MRTFLTTVAVATIISINYVDFVHAIQISSVLKRIDSFRSGSSSSGNNS